MKSLGRARHRAVRPGLAHDLRHAGKGLRHAPSFVDTAGACRASPSPASSVRQKGETPGDDRAPCATVSTLIVPALVLRGPSTLRPYREASITPAATAKSRSIHLPLKRRAMFLRAIFHLWSRSRLQRSLMPIGSEAHAKHRRVSEAARGPPPTHPTISALTRSPLVSSA